MNKKELIDHIAQETGLSKTKAREAVDALIEAIQDRLGAGEKVTLPGFGTFRVTERPARRGRNPATGEEIHIRPSRGIRFTAAKQLRDRSPFEETADPALDGDATTEPPDDWP